MSCSALNIVFSALIQGFPSSVVSGLKMACRGDGDAPLDYAEIQIFPPQNRLPFVCNSYLHSSNVITSLKWPLHVCVCGCASGTRRMFVVTERQKIWKLGL